MLQRLRCPTGSEEWLVRAEKRFGGRVVNVPRRKVSPFDPRSEEQIKKGGMVGGDRMEWHGYATVYSRFLAKFLRSRFCSGTLVEVGILKGTGLAIWCDLLPDWRIIGLDIDLSHFNANLADLKRRGAFKRNSPECFEFDQLYHDTDKLGSILEGDHVDIVIDDGLHSNEAILTTLDSIMPHLANEFVYFVEDNPNIYETLGHLYSQFRVHPYGALTVIRNA